MNKFSFEEVQAVLSVMDLDEAQRSTIDVMLKDAEANRLSIITLLPNATSVSEVIEDFLTDENYGEAANDLGFIDDLIEDGGNLGPESIVTLRYSTYGDGQCFGYRYYADIDEAISGEIQKSLPTLSHYHT